MHNINIVNFGMTGDGVAAVYYDGKIAFSGDDYHDSIRNRLKGYMLALKDHNVTVPVTCWEIEDEESVDRFLDERASPPDVWPDDDWSKVATRCDNDYVN